MSGTIKKWISHRTRNGKKVRVMVRKYKSGGKIKYSTSRLTHKGRVTDSQTYPYKSSEPWENPKRRKSKQVHHALV